MEQQGVVRVYEEIADFFASGPSPAEILAFHLSNESVEWLRELLYKNSAGTLTADETDELDQVATLNRLLMLIRSRISSERRWDEAFAASTDALAQLADEALAEHRAGQTEPLDLDDEG